jgi:hypothetical protein
MICPANQAIYNTEVNSCALSLYLQSSQAGEMCKRTVFTRPAPPKLERHGSVLLYYLAEAQLLHLQWQHNRSWETHTVTLEGGGVLQNTGSCSLTLRGIQLYSALEREAEFSARGPALFTPTVPALATVHEMEVLQQMSLLNGTNLEQLSTNIPNHHIESDINTLFHLHASTLRHANRSNCVA